MNVVRKSELFCKAVDWLTETSKSRAETYNTLRHWGMTDEEIKEIPTMADFIDDGSKESLYISAFVQCKSDIGNDSLVLPLPTAQSDMLLKLKSIGYFFTNDKNAKVTSGNITIIVIIPRYR